MGHKIRPENYFIKMANERCSTFNNLRRSKLILNELLDTAKKVKVKVIKFNT